MFSIQVLDKKQISSCLHMTFPRYRFAIEKSPCPVVVAMMFYGKPIGCVFAKFNPEKKHAFIYSLFVQKRYQKKGIGSSLLKRLEEELQKKDCQEISTVYTEGDFSKTIESILKKQNWEKPTSLEVLYELPRKSLSRLLSTSWVKKLSLPSYFQVTPWTNLSEEQVNELENEKPYPDDLSPFVKSPELMDEATSLALVRDGKICGWMLTFWQNENALVFNCFFVREELQKVGVGVAFLKESIQLCDEVYGKDRLKKIIAKSLPENASMIYFVENRLGPYLDKIIRNYQAKKTYLM